MGGRPTHPELLDWLALNFLKEGGSLKKLHRYVEAHERAIEEKTEIIVDHFLTQVAARRKVGGRARAMVVTNSIARAIQYFHVISKRLRELNSPLKAIVAFSGEYDQGGQRVTEATLNGFPRYLEEEWDTAVTWPSENFSSSILKCFLKKWA